MVLSVLPVVITFDEYVEHYDNDRIKMRLNGKSPVKYRTLYQNIEEITCLTFGAYHAHDGAETRFSSGVLLLFHNTCPVATLKMTVIEKQEFVGFTACHPHRA